METNEQIPITYKREKGKIQISGEPKQTKPHIWYEQINASLLWIVPVIVLFCIIPKASLLPFVLQWFKKYILLATPLVAAVDFLKVLLSG